MVSFECRLKPYISTGQTSMTTRLPKRNINAHVSSMVFNIRVVITDSTQWLHNTCVYWEHLMFVSLILNQDTRELY